MQALADPVSGPASSLTPVRHAQAIWERAPVRQRLRLIRSLRHSLVGHAEKFAAELAMLCRVSKAEKLMSELLPLIEACRWLEREAGEVLAPRRYRRRHRPRWLGNVVFEQQRKPFGVVLVIGPGNYPLFLPAVHALQALVAGNAVLWKPAPGSSYLAAQFASLVHAAGLDGALVTVLPEQVHAAREAIRHGIDKVVFTGSSINGRELLATLAPTNTPAVVELSGDDAAIVLADADIHLVVSALRFGLRLNNGATCMAPRRVFAQEPLAPLLQRLLTKSERCQLSITSARDAAEIIELANDSDWGLGASVFSRNLREAHRVATQLRTGFVSINDIIAPSADPRIPFGGVKASGFGTTRGAEGLLEMTYPHVIATRRDRRWWHLDPVTDSDTGLFGSLLAVWHGRPRERVSAAGGIVRGLRRRRIGRKEQI